MIAFAKDMFTHVPPKVPRRLRRAYLFGMASGSIGLVCHALVFLPMFWLLGLKTLAFINVFSASFYLLAVVIIRRGGWIYLSYSIAMLEVVAHSALAVMFIGVESGFHYYILAAMCLATFLPVQPRIINTIVMVSMVLSFWILQIYGEMHTAWAQVDASIVRIMFAFNCLVSLGMVGSFILYYRSLAIVAEIQLREEHELAESLLRNILPESIAAQLKSGQGSLADSSEETSVLFSDIVGFTQLSAGIPAEQLVAFLNDVFCEFDDLTIQYGVEKIKTIGDAYMVASGIPEHRDDHAKAVALMALGMRDVVQRISDQGETPLDIRIGIHTGPVVAGVIGKVKFAYDLWGDTVNTAARMESHGEPGKIQVTRSTYELLQEDFEFEHRGSIEVKGKGKLETWFLLGPKSCPEN